VIETIDVDYPHPYPPRITEFTRRFWDGLREGRLITTAGRRSGQAAFPPKPISPQDWDEEVDWIELSGKGKLYSHTTIHAAPAAFVHELPYRVCIVDLDENVRLATRFVGENEPRVGEPVEIVAVRYTDFTSYAARTLTPPV
jgi:uncharacterized OB-fold protein